MLPLAPCDGEEAGNQTHICNQGCALFTESLNPVGCDLLVGMSLDCSQWVLLRGGDGRWIDGYLFAKQRYKNASHSSLRHYSYLIQWCILAPSLSTTRTCLAHAGGFAWPHQGTKPQTKCHLLQMERFPEFLVTRYPEEGLEV